MSRTDVTTVAPVAGPLDADVEVPGSKSMTNRALICAALAEGTSVLDGALFADDTEAMLEGLGRLGISIEIDRDAQRITVHGCGGSLPPSAVGASLDARLSGTTSRFLLPLLALGKGPIRLDAAAPMRARPMADGIDALRSLGVSVTDEGEPGHLPVTVDGPPSPPADGPAHLAVAGDASSQFLSGLLLSAPAWPGGLRLAVGGELVSRPYIEMTVAVLRAFGAQVTVEGDLGRDDDGAEGDNDTWTVAPTGYRAADYRVEPDASAASYFFGAAAVCGGRVTIDGLGRSSLQGDLGFVEVLARMGCEVEQSDAATTVIGPPPGALRAVDVDMRHISDTAPTLAAVAVFAEAPSRLRGIGFIRHKESDRIGDVARELRRCGITVDEVDDGMVVHPGAPQPARLATYEDHRLAMSFALLGLRAPGIEVADASVVAKTFPAFWDVLARLGSGRAEK
jgi:3-phosphoshikimate 1-carboxyvinyltransferase